MLYQKKIFRLIRPVNAHLKTDKWDYLRWPMTDQKIFFNVLALENILVAQTREIGDGPCFLYIKFSWIGVRPDLQYHMDQSGLIRTGPFIKNHSSKHSPNCNEFQICFTAPAA